MSVRVSETVSENTIAIATEGDIAGGMANVSAVRRVCTHIFHFLGQSRAQVQQIFDQAGYEISNVVVGEEYIACGREKECGGSEGMHVRYVDAVYLHGMSVKTIEREIASDDAVGCEVHHVTLGNWCDYGILSAHRDMGLRNSDE